MKTYTDKALERIRSFITINKLPIYRFAQHADMAESTVRNVMDEDFDPRASTLRKMEQAADKDLSTDT